MTCLEIQQTCKFLLQEHVVRMSCLPLTLYSTEQLHLLSVHTPAGVRTGAKLIETCAY